LKQTDREKVIRIIASAYKNLLDHKGGADHSFNQDMIGSGVQKAFQNIMTRNLKDKDIEEDIKPILAKLDLEMEELSSFEMYQAEVEQGNLTWGPVHTEQFWSENYNKFERKEFALITRLIALLTEVPIEENPMVAEVAAYDLGEFARFYPDGKRVIEHKGGKIKLMSLLSSENPSVKKQALLAVQKLMVQNWEFLNKGGMGGKDKNKAKKNAAEL